MKTLFGVQDQNIKYLEALLDVNIGARGNELMIDGDRRDIATVEQILNDFADLFGEGRTFSDQELKDAFKQIAEDRAYSLKDYFKTSRFNPSGKKQVAPKSANQRKYIEAIQNNDLVFGIGPAGTGKSFLGVAMAVQALFEKRVSRIILTRPAVEAGEKLGFLPGDLQDKVDPYLRPLYDALFDLVDTEKVTKMLEKRIIEIAPLAFMRGRAQPLGSLLLTPSGWKKMGRVKIGDQVFGSAGLPVSVTGVFPQGEKNVYRLLMSDGSSTLACAEHLWQVRPSTGKKSAQAAPRVLQTGQMLADYHQDSTLRYEIPLIRGPIVFPCRLVPADPYIFGLSLSGKGESEARSEVSLQTFFASCPDHPIIAAEDAAGRAGALTHSVVNKMYRFYPRNRDTTITELQISAGLIPQVYLQNCPSVRRSLLQGILDGSGWPAEQNGSIWYTTRSAKLADDLCFLVRSLGGLVYRRNRKRSIGRRGFNKTEETINLEIFLPQKTRPFRQMQKASQYGSNGRSRSLPCRWIKKIEFAGRMETRCISVDAPDSLYLTDDLILTHNTLADAFIILDEAQNTTSEQMKMFLTRIGFGSKTVVTGDKTQIDLPFGKKSGIKEAEKILKDIEGIEFVHFTDKDVVRHKLVQMIVKAYDKYSRKDEDESEEKDT